MGALWRNKGEETNFRSSPSQPALFHMDPSRISCVPGPKEDEKSVLITKLTYVHGDGRGVEEVLNCCPRAPEGEMIACA